MDAEDKRMLAELMRRVALLEGDRLERRSVVDEAVERVNRADAERRALNYPPADPLLATGAKSLDTILANLRRLDEGSDAGSTPDPDPGSGGLGSGWAGLSTAEKIEALRAALCAMNGALNGASISAICNEDGTITVTLTLPDLPPPDLCSAV